MNRIISKYRTLSTQAKAAFWFTGCSFLQKGISFITVPIFTRMMSIEEYGIYTLYVSWYQILIIITSLYLFNGVYDNAMSKFEGDRDKFTSSIQGLSITVTLIVFFLYLISNKAWESLLGLPNVYIVLMFMEMLVAPAAYFWSARQRFEYQYKRLVVITVMKSLVNPLLGLILVSLFSDKALGRVISIVIVELVFDLTLMIYQFVKGKVFFDKIYWKYGITLAIPLIPHYLAGIILNQGDRVMIDRLVGKSAVAMYGVAYSIGMLVQIFVNAINSAITPWIYASMKEKKISEIHNKLNPILVLVAVLICGLITVSPELVMVFGTEKYVDAVFVIPPVAASVYFIFLYGILAFPEFYYEKTKFLMFASIGAAALNVVLNYVFIKKYGFVAAGYTTLVCYIIYSIGHYIVGKKILNKHIPGATMLDNRFMVMISFVVIAESIIGRLLIPFALVRYGIALIIIAFTLCKWKKIVSFLRNGEGGQ